MKKFYRFRIVKWLSPLLLLILAAKPAHSQDTLWMDLDAFIQSALTNNRTLKADELSVQIAEYQLKETKGGLLPRLTASGSYMRNIDLPVIFMPEGSPFGRTLQIGYDNSFSGGLQASVALFSAQLYSAIEMSRQNLALQIEKKKENELNLKYEVTRAYYGALYAREAARVIHLSYQNAIDNYKNVEAMYKQGLASEFDLLRARVNAENLKPSVSDLDNAYRVALSMLKFLAGIDKSQVIGIKGDLELNPSSGKVSPADDLSNNPTLRQMKLQLGLLSIQEEMTRKSIYPTLAGIWNFQYQSQANDFKFKDYEWVRTQSAGIQLSIPLFSGFTTKNKIKQLQLSQEQLKLQNEYLTDNLKIQLENNFKTMQLAYEKVESAKENIKLAKRSYEIAQSAYKTGTATLLDLNNSRLALTQAQLNYYQAVYEYELSKLEYFKILGIN